MLFVLRLRNRWMTIESGRVGDENEPEVERPDDEKKEDKPEFKLGFSK
jgi:hypothetical protein